MIVDNAPRCSSVSSPVESRHVATCKHCVLIVRVDCRDKNCAATAETDLVECLAVKGAERKNQYEGGTDREKFFHGWQTPVYIVLTDRFDFFESGRTHIKSFFTDLPTRSRFGKAGAQISANFPTCAIFISDGFCKEYNHF